MLRRSFLAVLPLLTLFVSALGLSDLKELREQGASNVHSTSFARNLLNFPLHGPHGEKEHGAVSVPFHHDHHTRRLFGHDGPHFHKEEYGAPSIPFHHDPHARLLLGHDFHVKDHGAPSIPIHHDHHARRLFGHGGPDFHKKEHGASSIPFHHDHHARRLAGHDGPGFHNKERGAPSIPFHHDHHARRLFGHDGPHSDKEVSHIMILITNSLRDRRNTAPKHLS